MDFSSQLVLNVPKRVKHFHSNDRFCRLYPREKTKQKEEEERTIRPMNLHFDGETKEQKPTSLVLIPKARNTSAHAHASHVTGTSMLVFLDYQAKFSTAQFYPTVGILF